MKSRLAFIFIALNSYDAGFIWTSLSPYPQFFDSEYSVWVHTATVCFRDSKFENEDFYGKLNSIIIHNIF
jgi:hypothetical protein